jgi:hypothetical protein
MRDRPPKSNSCSVVGWQRPGLKRLAFWVSTSKIVRQFNNELPGELSLRKQ